MATIIEATYENGVLKPRDASGLKEHQRYRLVLEEIALPEAVPDPSLAAEIKQRMTILPDGRKIVRLGGILAVSNIPDDEDPIADALDELRRERSGN